MAEITRDALWQHYVSLSEEHPNLGMTRLIAMIAEDFETSPEIVQETMFDPVKPSLSDWIYLAGLSLAIMLGVVAAFAAIFALARYLGA